MKYTSLKIKELIGKSEEKELLLPNFQREYVWERKDNQVELLASLLYDIPIGSLLILNGESGFFATKELCIRKQFNNSGRDSTLYLLDGQQRISTIKSIFFDFFSDPKTWRENYKNLYPKLRTRWFLKIRPDEGQADIFGWEKLKLGDSKWLNETNPSEIVQAVKAEIIYPNKVEEWYHPEYGIKEWYKDKEINANVRKNIVSKKAAEVGLVPLYTILGVEEKDTATLHYKTLKKIAQDRVLELKSQVEDNLIDINDILSDYDEDNEEEAWNSLKDDWINDIMDFLNSIREKEIPVIQLVKEEMSRAIYTFEKVNKGGTVLSTYDLVVAKAAYNMDLEKLTDRIINIIEKELIIPDGIIKPLKGVESDYKWHAKNMELVKDHELTPFIKNQYLNLLSVFSYFQYGSFADMTIDYIKKNKQLNLESDQINSNTESTITCLLRACAFLQFRCGIVKAGDISYQLMILPIAYVLKDDDVWNDATALDKIEYWYWSSLFSGIYRINPNKQSISDIEKLYNFIKNNENTFEEREKKVFKVDEFSNLDTLIYKDKEIKIQSAVKNGMLQYILSKQPKDFIDDNIYLNAWDVAAGKEYTSKISNKKVKLSLHDHHVCPLNSATKLGESSKELRSEKVKDTPGYLLNSPLNRTYISANANVIISDKKPEDYFKYVTDLAKYGHCIPCPIIENYKIKGDESEEEFYLRILKARYHEMLRDISEELDKLKGSN